MVFYDVLPKGKKKAPNFSFQAVKIHCVQTLEVGCGVLTDGSSCSQILNLKRPLEFTYFNKKHC